MEGLLRKEELNQTGASWSEQRAGREENARAGGGGGGGKVSPDQGSLRALGWVFSECAETRRQGSGCHEAVCYTHRP